MKHTHKDISLVLSATLVVLTDVAQCRNRLCRLQFIKETMRKWSMNCDNLLLWKNETKLGQDLPKALASVPSVSTSALLCRIISMGESNEGVTKLWNISGECLRVFEAPGEEVASSSLSTDGELLLTASGKSAKLWRVSDGKRMASYKDETNVPDHRLPHVTSVMFSYVSSASIMRRIAVAGFANGTLLD